MPLPPDDAELALLDAMALYECTGVLETETLEVLPLVSSSWRMDENPMFVLVDDAHPLPPAMAHAVAATLGAPDMGRHLRDGAGWADQFALSSSMGDVHAAEYWDGFGNRYGRGNAAHIHMWQASLTHNHQNFMNVMFDDAEVDEGAWNERGADDARVNGLSAPPLVVHSSPATYRFDKLSFYDSETNIQGLQGEAMTQAMNKPMDAWNRPMDADVHPVTGATTSTSRVVNPHMLTDAVLYKAHIPGAAAHGACRISPGSPYGCTPLSSGDAELQARLFAAQMRGVGAQALPAFAPDV